MFSVRYAGRWLMHCELFHIRKIAVQIHRLLRVRSDKDRTLVTCAGVRKEHDSCAVRTPRNGYEAEVVFCLIVIKKETMTWD